MDFIELLNSIVGFGTLVMQIFIILFILFAFYHKKFNKKLPNFIDETWNFIRENALFLVFLMMLAGTILSLVYSEFIGYEACVLCWYQRAMIYPQVIILGVALLKKFRKIFDYVIGLNIIGLIIAIYQYYLQMSGTETNCGAGSIACNSIYILEFGYITIPMMSITLFISSIILTYIWKKE